MITDESPFYLAVNNQNPKPGQMWFKCSPLGVNSYRSILKNMIRDSFLETDKKLVNHSTRKYLVQKLVDNDIPPNEIIQITGHKNVNSLNNYSSLSDKKQQQISAVLSNAASTSQSLSAVCIEENTKAESFLSGATSEKFISKLSNRNGKCPSLSVPSNWKVFKDSLWKQTENHCIWWFKSKSVIFSVFMCNISSQNFAWLGLVFLYTWHHVLFCIFCLL